MTATESSSEPLSTAMIGHCVVLSRRVIVVASSVARLRLAITNEVCMTWLTTRGRDGETPMGEIRLALITGGAGFLGGHLCERLLADGAEVICVDDLSTSAPSAATLLQDRPGYRFVRHDISDPSTGLPLRPAPDTVFHLASPASPLDYLRLPVQTLRAGAVGTANALDVAESCGARLVLASTSEVYGDPLEHPQRETYWGNVNPIGPRSVYDEAKRFAEALTVAYRRFHRVDTKIVRIFNTYGPRMRVKDGRAVPAFISQALVNEDVTVFGDGTQTRSFCYITDLVDGIIKLMLSKEEGPINIGNPREMTIEEIARTIIRMTGSSSRIVHRDLPVDDPKVRQPDITRARTLLQWEPKVQLEEG